MKISVFGKHPHTSLHTYLLLEEHVPILLRGEGLGSPLLQVQLPQPRLLALELAPHAQLLALCGRVGNTRLWG